MAKKLSIDPIPMTWESFLTLGPERSRPHGGGEDLDREVEALEEDLGPQVPAFLCRKGRPPKGSEVPPVQPRVVKMPPAFWETMNRLAEESGQTLHGAMREALLDWTRNHLRPKVG